MATIEQPANQGQLSKARSRLRVRPLSSARFDVAMVLLAAVFGVGVYVDGFAHNHGAIDESFFTPWHIGMYGGWFSIATLLAVEQYRNVGKGYSWWYALPRGYVLAFIGVFLFMLGGMIDMLWHTYLGFEENAEALISPTHLILATGGTFFVSGPFRSVWLRTEADTPPGWAGLLPRLLSIFVLFSLTTFMSQFSNAFFGPDFLTVAGNFDSDYYAQQYFWDTTAITYIIVPTAIMMGYFLLAIRRWKTLPPGSLTVMLSANAAMMFTLRIDERVAEHWPVLIAALLGGLVADALLVALKPGRSVLGLRLFAAVTPHVFFTLYFLTLALTQDLWPRAHLWLGLPFLAGAVGLGISFLLAPPQMPEE